VPRSSVAIRQLNALTTFLKTLQQVPQQNGLPNHQARSKKKPGVFLLWQEIHNESRKNCLVRISYPADY
jgi:hypothetical protein